MNNPAAAVYNPGTTLGTGVLSIVDSSLQHGLRCNPSTNAGRLRSRFRTSLSTARMPRAAGSAGDIHSRRVSINNNIIFN